MSDLKHFRYWCYKVLPLVYDDSLSYYEVLCKVVEYINNLIDDNKLQGNDINALQNELKKVQEFINNLDTSYVENLVAKYIANMIYVYISDAGYITYYIPNSWNDIQFNTTGLDITNEQLVDECHVGDFEYGRLVLSMFVGETI